VTSKIRSKVRAGSSKGLVMRLLPVGLLAVGGLLLSGCVPLSSSDDEKSAVPVAVESSEPAVSDSPEPEPSPAEESTPSQTQTPTPTPSPETSEAYPELGERVEEAALSAYGVDSFTAMTGSPVVAVTGFEDVNSETVRINVQESLTDAGKDDVARWFFNMTCEQVPEVQTFVVRDLSGVDSNHYAGELSRMPACQ